MFAVPFGLIGAFAGHFLLGHDFTLWSVIGMMAVSGVVVNDNLVLVDYINRNRDQGSPLRIAIREAGAVRFRPIMLTTITTFGGLTPLMLERSLQAKFLIPMAISLAFGVLFATLVSLVLVPCAYHIIEDIKRMFSSKTLLKMMPGGSTAYDGDQMVLAAAEENTKKQWHLGLDEAYEQGYAQGLNGKDNRHSPFDVDVLTASWEAGWDDGFDEYRRKRS